jgi:hypothetical protein
MPTEIAEDGVPQVANEIIANEKPLINYQDAATSKITRTTELEDDSDKQQFLVFEVCSGSAKFTYACHETGFFSVPFDHNRNSHNTWWPTVCLDLSDIDQCALLLEAIEAGQVHVILAALPCGTCSKAREIPLSKSHHGPKPLRSNDYPRGLPHLSGVDLIKVQKANSIYSNIYICLMAALAMGVGIIIENPRNSYLWEIPEFRDLVHFGLFDVDFEHCRWSPEDESRPKWTRLRTNITQLAQLAGKCSLSHRHLGWGVLPNGTFATAGESEYPIGMCRAMVSCIHEYLKPLGFVPKVPAQLDSMDKLQGHKKRRVVTTNQPRGRKVPDLISEFKAIMKLPPESPTSEWHRILRHDVERGEMDDEGSFADRAYPVVGIYRTPLEFVNDSMNISHPADLQGVLPDCICQSLSFLLVAEPDEVIRKQLFALRELTKLLSDTKDLHEQRSLPWDSDTKKLMMGKNLTAFESLLSKYPEEFLDTTLVSEMYAGFSLVGLEKYKKAFDYEPVLPSCTVKQLQTMSKHNNLSLCNRTKSSGSDDIDSKLWELAMEERNQGWLIGPFSTVEELLPYTMDIQPHLSRRFPLDQGSKLRPIDDFAESSVNQCHGRFDKLWLMDVDYVAALLRSLEVAIFNESPTLISDTGSKYDIASIKDRQGICFLGKTIDLKSAYKQLFVKNSDRWASCISVYNPHTGKPSLFCQVTLPFGASSSVLHFNRVSRAI